jgi:hypothetical protein
MSVPSAGNREDGGQPVGVGSKTAFRLSQEARSMKVKRPGPSTGRLARVESRYFRRPIGPPGRTIAKKSAVLRRLILRLFFFSRHARVCFAYCRLQERNRKSAKLPRHIILSDISLQERDGSRCRGEGHPSRRVTVPLVLR